tara:strand:- start:239 stop:481 length:243 start_codon:yes stop_codon:yes gene_type:complete
MKFKLTDLYLPSEEDTFQTYEEYNEWVDLSEDLIQELHCCIKDSYEVAPKEHLYTCEDIEALAIKFYELGKVHGKQASRK